MAESIQNILRTTNASPTRQVQDAQSVPSPFSERKHETDAEVPSSPFKVEDKVELKIEPEAVRQLKPNTHLKFLVSDDTSRVVVQIIQSDTNEVLREVPPKSLSEALAALNGGPIKHVR